MRIAVLGGRCSLADRRRVDPAPSVPAISTVLGGGGGLRDGVMELAPAAWAMPFDGHALRQRSIHRTVPGGVVGKTGGLALDHRVDLDPLG